MPPWSSKLPGRQNNEWGGKFSLGYANLHRFVRHPGIESDLRLLTPMDFHADTTELVQLLRKGHRRRAPDCLARSDKLGNWEIGDIILVSARTYHCT